MGSSGREKHRIPHRIATVNATAVGLFIHKHSCSAFHPSRRELRGAWPPWLGEPSLLTYEFQGLAVPRKRPRNMEEEYFLTRDASSGESPSLTYEYFRLGPKLHGECLMGTKEIVVW